MLKLCSAIMALGLSLSVSATELVIETWRVEDAKLWQEQILPSFHARYPDITVKLTPVPSSEYQATVTQRLAEDKAGDLITCRPYDESLQLFQKGYLEDLTDLEGMENFPSFAKAAWQTDTGAQTFCLPIASVIQGFYYNLDIFKELGLEVPKTRADFFALMDKVKSDGRYQPLALAAHDNWVVSELGFQNIGPNYWHGEDGRMALIEGKARFTDQPYVAVFDELSRWLPYLGNSPADTTEAMALEAYAGGWILGHQSTRWQGELWCILSTGCSEWGCLLFHGSHRHGDCHQRQEQEQGGGQEAVGMDGQCRVCRAFLQCGARFLLALESLLRAEESGSQHHDELA